MAVDMRVTWKALGGSLEMSWPCIPSNVHLIPDVHQETTFYFLKQKLSLKPELSKSNLIGQATPRDLPHLSA